MPYSQKYCLVSFKCPIGIGIEFEMSDWPLHATLADVFAIDRRKTKIERKLKELFTKEPFVITYGTGEATLGTTKLVLLDKNDSLLALHTHTVDLLKQNGAEFNTPEFTKKGFLPHCTIQKTGQLYSRDKFEIRSLTLVDMFPNDNWQRRKVLHTFKLYGG